ncbi:hypothetical protein ACOMHN_022021 [Nucella lapillus]
MPGKVVVGSEAVCSSQSPCVEMKDGRVGVADARSRLTEEIPSGGHRIWHRGHKVGSWWLNRVGKRSTICLYQVVHTPLRSCLFRVVGMSFSLTPKGKG